MTRRFFYHAFGVGLGGRIRRPFCDVIEAQAATALPIVGGYASSRVDGYRFHDIVSCRSARISAVGTEAPDGSFNTSVSVTIEGLNILDVITADTITARLASLHGPDAPQPAITAVGTEFRGLRIAGNPITVEVDRDLFYNEWTHDDFKKKCAADDSKDEDTARHPAPRIWSESKRMIVGSLVRGLSGQTAELATTGCAIKVPMVGTVFLGETIVTEHARRLTMVRVHLGSPVEGDLEACSVEVDGSTYP